MNWFVGDGVTHGGIAGASWNYDWYDYGNGWYYVAVGANTWLQVSASGHVSATFNTDYYDPNNAGAIYLARQTTGGTGGKK
jgi:sorbitol-specific phosphotransferase system component IIA